MSAARAGWPHDSKSWMAARNSNSGAPWRRPVGGRCESRRRGVEVDVGVGAHPQQFGVVDMHAGVQAGAGPMGLAGAAVNKSPNEPDQSHRS